MVFGCVPVLVKFGYYAVDSHVIMLVSGHSYGTVNDLPVFFSVVPYDRYIINMNNFSLGLHQAW